MGQERCQAGSCIISRRYALSQTGSVKVETRLTPGGEFRTSAMLRRGRRKRCFIGSPDPLPDLVAEGDRGTAGRTGAPSLTVSTGTSFFVPDFLLARVSTNSTGGPST